MRLTWNPLTPWGPVFPASPTPP